VRQWAWASRKRKSKREMSWALTTLDGTEEEKVNKNWGVVGGRGCVVGLNTHCNPTKLSDRT